ncbi:MAG: alginate lyase family protein [Lentisphaeria bacterium]|nr:alginate lyase family protein [Lentisphaeria bacterium]
MTAFDLCKVDRPRILAKAERYLNEAPRTVTSDSCDKSAGGPHDFFSQGDYWWPDPQNPGGPYISCDGETNPENFIEHRKSMIRFADIIGTLASAYLLTGNDMYASQAVAHLTAWFIDESTKMNPHLLYGQMVVGRCSGRSIGIIDTIHLAEVARGAKLLSASPAFSPDDQVGVKAWFRQYLTWINTHEYGITEKHHPNNHGVCWSLQAAAFADYLDEHDRLAWIRDQFKSVYIGVMMAGDGSLSKELARTKPYGYSLFTIDAMAAVAQIASTPEDDLWRFELPDGRGMRRGLEFIYPYIVDKEKWPWARDIMYWDDWPARQISLLLAGLAFDKPDYLETWQALAADPPALEIKRNLPLRHPLLWVKQ